MNKVFGDKSITIQYIQQLLHDTYNGDIIVNSEYYRSIDMNYGLAHFIAKYLDSMYPLLDGKAIQEYEQIKNIVDGTDIPPRDISEPISIMNYFLCSNRGGRLYYDPHYYSEKVQKTNKSYYVAKKNPSGMYDEIYNNYMVASYIPEIDKETGYIDETTFAPKYPKYFIHNDPPLFTSCTYDDGIKRYKYKFEPNTIFTLQCWDTQKQICELDDLVCSYLLGRTIGPNSSMEDIYYVQKLLITGRDIQRFEKGIWCPEGYNGTIYDMTQTVINYQKQIVSTGNQHNVFVTGYFDIFTEAFALKEAGSKSYGILGL